MNSGTDYVGAPGANADTSDRGGISGAGERAADRTNPAREKSKRGGGRAVVGPADRGRADTRAEIDLHPKTERVQAWEVEEGDVVIESHLMPAVVVKVKRSNGPVHLYCRYLWEPEGARAWKWGPILPGSLLDRAIPSDVNSFATPSPTTRSEES